MDLPPGNSSRAKRRRIQKRVNEHMNSINREANDEAQTMSTFYEEGSSEGAANRIFSILEGPTQQPAARDRALDSNEAPSELRLDMMTSECDTTESQSISAAEKLRTLAVKHNLTHGTVNSILQLLNEMSVPELPKDARTLLGTNTAGLVTSKAGGRYYYFGIKPTLKLMAEKMKTRKSRTLTLQVNIDGLPLFKSSRQALWPILFSVQEWKSDEVFMAGVFCGVKKPEPVGEFLQDLVNEIKSLETSGVQAFGMSFVVKLNAIICDAPARAFLKCIKGHTGHAVCERCEQHGIYDSGRMSFAETGAQPRTDETFRRRQDEVHHLGESPLLDLDIDIVSAFPLDYMHLVCLGVTRKLINLWMDGPREKYRMSTSVKSDVSQRLLQLRSFVCSEFSRRPRTLTEHKLWKATELRQFLLYTGPVVLQNQLPKQFYQHFLVLHVAVSLLLYKLPVAETISYSEQLLHSFVQRFKLLYGSNRVSYNVHSLIHLADDARKYGCLDKISAFPFENFLQKLKKLVRKPQHVVEQIIRRIKEIEISGSYLQASEEFLPVCIHPHSHGPLPTGFSYKQQFTKYKGQWVLTTSATGGDCCIQAHGKLFVIQNIVEDKEENIHLVVERLVFVRNLYTYPLCSSKLGIQLVKSSSASLSLIQVRDVEMKYLLLPYANDYVAFPLLHC